MISEEDLIEWREHPVTLEVFKALEVIKTRAKDRWLTASWEQGVTDVGLLCDLRAREQIASDIQNISYEVLEEALDYEPKRDQPDRVQGSGSTG